MVAAVPFSNTPIVSRPVTDLDTFVGTKVGFAVTFDGIPVQVARSVPEAEQRLRQLKQRLVDKQRPLRALAERLLPKQRYSALSRQGQDTIPPQLDSLPEPPGYHLEWVPDSVKSSATTLSDEEPQPQPEQTMPLHASAELENEANANPQLQESLSDPGSAVYASTANNGVDSTTVGGDTTSGELYARSLPMQVQIL